ncbi:hypothetical protein [Symbiobacterium thermophilum]|uniref:Uncharacterized protein n=1 Tax=Symbiobacterium thermophilum TaxID=2734 RepID=A0A953LID1_SYMTR|nr:hypothetical protein [Symbiobacterium thermophilum]MBY6278168.1 hypothetical protein [Symbiobacterium thermophilum]
MAVQWIKDEEGGLVNLRHVYSISLRRRESLQDPRYDVLAFLAGGSIRLYTGPKDECERYLANLAQQLEVIG